MGRAARCYRHLSRYRVYISMGAFGELSGYNRVFVCAAARAIELQTVVCAVGAVGSPQGHLLYDIGMGGASVYVPCDSAVEPAGIVASLGPHTADSGLSPILYAADIPVGHCRRLRHGAAEAEVWPSSWPIDQVAVLDPATSVPVQFS